MKRKFPNISPSEWKLKKINLEEFIMLFVNGCFFMRLKPLRSDMSIIFNMLDTDKDGYITFADYFSFIRKFLCGGFELPDVA